MLGLSRKTLMRACLTGMDPLGVGISKLSVTFSQGTPATPRAPAPTVCLARPPALRCFTDHCTTFSTLKINARWWRHVVWWLISAFLSVLLLGACTVPEHMRVRAGIDPRNQDDQVRFRTTYYFRIFDVCRNPANDTINGLPKSDSLYRFRMTGKAHSLFSQVHFESGTLHKSEIDPFGANIVFDDKLGRYRFVSRAETDATARRNERYDEIERRLKLLEDLDGANRDNFTEIRQKLLDSIQNQIVNLDATIISSPTKSKDNNHPDNSESKAAKGCPERTELKRAFQIMGPEGISTFDQDQRLVMAMTSSGKPLISALKELSGHMLKEHGSGSELLLPLAQENIATLRAKRVVDKIKDDPNVSSDQLFERVINAFNQDIPKEAR